jgi:hypothetical protein
MNSRPLFGLFHRRECVLPTRGGWLVLVLACAIFAVAALRSVYPFLAVHDSIPGGVLVAEGWLPDYALAETLAEFRRHPYSGIYVTGVPMESGAVLSEYKTYAELSAAVLVRLGADPQTVHAVPSTPVLKDRTYATAVTLRQRLRDEGSAAGQVNVVSLGPHARRTRLLYEKAFGPATRVGVIAINPSDFEAARWWRSSQGFRIVTGEVVAYLYARCCFHPAPEEPPESATK